MSLALAPTYEVGALPKSRTVLVVDHRETIRRVLSLILESEGYQVVSTDTATSAVALAIELQPSAMMLDLSLTGMSASAALQELKSDARTANVPIILLAECRSRLTDEERAEAAAILRKPVDIDALIAQLEAILARAV
jgi:DNA-binding response OmpR family regulator